MHFNLTPFSLYINTQTGTHSQTARTHIECWPCRNSIIRGHRLLSMCTMSTLKCSCVRFNSFIPLAFFISASLSPLLISIEYIQQQQQQHHHHHHSMYIFNYKAAMRVYTSQCVSFYLFNFPRFFPARDNSFEYS